MKLIKTLTAMTFALALIASPAMALDAKGHKQGGCCAKATKAGKECTHKCCVAAAKKGNECEKCGGKGKLPKKEKKDS